MFDSRANKFKHFSSSELKKFFNALETARYEESFNRKSLAYRNAVRNEAMFKIMYYCGLRVTEVITLPLDNYNSFRDEIYCQRLKNGISNTLTIVDKKILEAFKRHLKVNKPQKYLFENNMNGQESRLLSRKTLARLMIEYCQKAELSNKDKWHCHTLRHTRAVDLLDMGASIYDVQYWLGHSDITNTQIYLTFTSKQKERLYNTIMQRDK